MDESRKTMSAGTVIFENEDTKVTATAVSQSDNGGYTINLHCKGVIPYGYWVRSAAVDGTMCEPYNNFLKPTEEGDMELLVMVVYGTGQSLQDGKGGYTIPKLEEINEIALEIVVLEDDGSYGDVDEPNDIMANGHGIAAKSKGAIYPNGGEKQAEYTAGGVRAVLFDNEQFVVFLKDIMDSERIAYPNSEEYRQELKTRKVVLSFINKTQNEMYFATHSCYINDEPEEVNHIGSRVLSGMSAIDALQYIRPKDEFNNEIKKIRFAIAVQMATQDGPQLIMNNAVEIKM